MCIGISVKVKPIDLYFAYTVDGLIFTAAQFTEKANEHDCFYGELASTQAI